MSARPTRLANVPLGREIGVHRREADFDFRLCGQPPVRHGFTLASLCRCCVPSGDFRIGVVTKGSERPLDEPLWAEIKIDEIAACPIAQTVREPSANQEAPWVDHSLCVLRRRGMTGFYY